MSVLFHLTIPSPALPASEAVHQEIAALQTHFGGELNYLYPFRRPGVRAPRQIYGLHQLLSLRKKERQFSLHHIFNADLFPFPALAWLRKPVVYTVVAGLPHHPPRLSRWFEEAVHTVVVSNRRDLRTIREWGIARCAIVPPGIDLGRFRYSPPPDNGLFTILAGSAPWTIKQFHQKGVDLLFSAAQKLPDLRLVLLWRGLLLEALQERIRQYELEGRVEVIARQVDVNIVLGRVHAAVVLSDRPEIVKACPHSLLESLAAGKPVLVSQCIPFADYVHERNCGEVVDRFNETELIAAIKNLMSNYPRRQACAREAGQQDFSLEGMVQGYGQIYAECGLRP